MAIMPLSCYRYKLSVLGTDRTQIKQLKDSVPTVLGVIKQQQFPNQAIHTSIHIIINTTDAVQLECPLLPLIES